MLNNLKIGSKITILKPNEITPYKIYGTLEGVYISNFAQHENTLFLYIKPFKCRRIERVTISQNEVAFILDKDIKNLWKKEVVKNDGDVVVQQLHRLRKNDIDQNDIIYSHEYGEKFNANDNFEAFIDRTTDFMINEGVASSEAENNEKYIQHIKTLVTSYNVNKLKQYIKNEGYNILEKCINKAIQYNW